MSITIAQTVEVMRNRLEPLITASELESALDYHYSVAVALIEMGHTVSIVTAPTDSELTAVTDYNRFLDLVEVRLLDTVLNRLSLQVDLTIGPRRESLGQIASALMKIIERKRTALDRRYGTSTPLSFGHWDTTEESRAVVRPFAFDNANDIAEVE